MVVCLFDYKILLLKKLFVFVQIFKHLFGPFLKRDIKHILNSTDTGKQIGLVFGHICIN